MPSRLANDNKMPFAVDGEGQVMVNAGKYVRNIVLAVFKDIGGRARMAEWAEENPGDYYTKLFSKLIPKEVEVETTVTIDDLLRQLDAKMIDATPRAASEPTEQV